jgi:asparagine synthase (glutamine-hydrolysing)
MAYGLEARAPFLDHHLVQFAASLPADYKLHGGVGKYVLKRAMRGLLPARILERPKMGFGVPIERWFRRELREMTNDVLLGPTAAQRGLFQPSVVRRMVDEHVAGTGAWHYQLWNLLCLELWLRTFIDARPMRAPLPVHARL